MRIDGEWFQCDDGVVRPVLRADVLTAVGTWEQTLFLVDTGADVTVFSAALAEVLEYPGMPTANRVGGVGGMADSIEVPTQIRLKADNDSTPLFRGSFAALTRHEALDMNVLGRDVLDLFAVIVDRAGNTIALLRDRHRYSIST